METGEEKDMDMYVREWKRSDAKVASKKRWDLVRMERATVNIVTRRKI